MTILEVLDCPEDYIDRLEKMSDKELEELFKPYLTVTRPEFVVKKSAIGKEPERIYIDPKKQAVLALLKESGVDMSFMNVKRKK
jgi:hypothetical protein